MKFPKVLPDARSYNGDFTRDCMFTHPEAIISLGKYGVLPKGLTYLEPSCGTGNLSEVLERNGYNVESFDIMGWGHGKIKSVSDHQDKSYDVSLTNPPYSIWEAFLRECLRISKAHVFLLFPTRYLEGQRRTRVFKETGLSRVYVLTYRLKMYNSLGERLSGMTSYAWYHWDFNFKPEHPELHWLSR